MNTDALAAADTPLSVDEAVGLLDAGRPGDEDETQSEAAPTAEDDEDPDDQAPLGEEADEDDPDEGPAIAPPRSWDAQARAAFAKLPPDIQAIIVEREGERDRAVSRAQQEAGDARRRAVQEAEGIAQHKGALEQLILRGQATFQDRWSDFDQNFPALVDQYGADQALKWRAQRDQELGELARLDAAHQDAARHQRARFLDTETQRLAELSPDLSDPRTGGERRDRLARWLVEQGVDRRMLPDLDARTVALAYDAMRFRLGQQKVHQAKQSKSTSAAARPGVKPTAAQAGRPQSRTAETAKARFAQSRSVDDAVALLNARSG